MENEDLLSAVVSTLEKEIETRILPAKKYPYVPASAVRSRLNEAFSGKWNTHIISSETINDDTILMLIELTCMVGDEKIVKEGYGSAPIHKYSSGQNQGKPVNLGDAYGNAVMDAIKSCAKQLGIGNKEMDVVKDKSTGKYVRVGAGNITTADNVTPTTQPETTSNEKINELKKKLEANKNKDKPATELKEPVVEKEDDVPMPFGSSFKKQENAEENTKTEPDANPDDAKAAKIAELRKKIEANKAGAVTKSESKPESKAESDGALPESWSSDVITKPESKPEPDANPDDAKAAKIAELRKKIEANKAGVVTKSEPKPEPELMQESKPEEVEPGYGFDYGGIGNSGDDIPKNTQKLVILNLAKMQKLTPEEYINKALGKKKAMDELTAEEAGQVVRAGLSKFE